VSQKEKKWSREYRKKIIEPKKLPSFIGTLRKQGKTIATLNGSFDLLHAGHLQIIFEASTLADILILALNSDASIQKYKSTKRPLIPLEYRLQLIAALEFVSYATWFEETDPRNILSQIKPDIHVNGMDYKQSCIEEDVVRSNGGTMHYVPLVPGLSTTDIINKILDIYHDQKVCT
jgi:D-glycero-beta-D-manno-heptose 1-phosphate adenylyltransferase